MEVNLSKLYITRSRVLKDNDLEQVHNLPVIARSWVLRGNGSGYVSRLMVVIGWESIQTLYLKKNTKSSKKIHNKNLANIWTDPIHGTTCRPGGFKCNTSSTIIGFKREKLFPLWHTNRSTIFFNCSSLLSKIHRLLH